MSTALDTLAPEGLNLDARQRAMLEEMRIPFWWPEPPVGELPQADELIAIKTEAKNTDSVLASAQNRTQTWSQEPAPPPRPTPTSTPVPAPAAEPAARPAPRLASAAAVHWALQAPVALYGSPVEPGGWLVLTEAVWSGADPLADAAAGKLLDNMLRAMRLHQTPRVWLAGLERADAPGSTTDAADLLARVKPGLVLLMGRTAARHALATEEPLGRLRGRVHDLNGVPAVVTYDAPYLLRAPGDKPKAWADLCLALDRMAGLVS